MGGEDSKQGAWASRGWGQFLWYIANCTFCNTLQINLNLEKRKDFTKKVEIYKSQTLLEVKVEYVL